MDLAEELRLTAQAYASADYPGLSGLLARAADVLAAAPPQRDALAAPSWQPIETAPKDGTAFRAFSEGLIDPDFNPGGSVECAFDGEGFIGCVWNGQQDAWYGKPINPTHWQPLPQPPGAAAPAQPEQAEAQVARLREALARIKQLDTDLDPSLGRDEWDESEAFAAAVKIVEGALAESATTGVDHD